MESLAELLKWVLENLNYTVVTIFMAIESSFIPFPSEAVVPPAAWKAMADDSMNIVMVVVMATIGADLGALINYYLAKWLGRPIVYKFANSRLGHLCLIDEEKVRHAEEYFRQHGAASTFFGRLIPAVRQLISIPAGLAGMKLGPFLLYTTLGAGIWNSILAALGYGIYRFTNLKTTNDVYQLATEYSHEIGYVILAIFAGVVLYLIAKAFKKKKVNKMMLWAIGATTTLSTLSGCGQDRWPEYYPYTGRDLWIDSVMREEYLWFEEMPSFNELNYFIAPQAFLDKVKSSKDKGFSKVDSIYRTAPVSYGFSYSLSRVPENDTAYYAMITYVEPQSPAAEAGLKRGEWIMSVNDDFITRKREKVLQEGEEKKLAIGIIQVRTETNQEGQEVKITEVVSDRSATLPATRPVEEELTPTQMFLPAWKAAYLVYNEFNPSQDEVLRQFTQQYRKNGAEHLILDLRYNDRGEMGSMQLAASLLAPADKLGAPLASLYYNSKKTHKNRILTLERELLQSGQNLNLKRLFVLTSAATAGMAEMLINGLKPYMQVVIIGENTKGEYIATEGFKNPAFEWEVRPAVCEVYNALDEAVYTNGFAPDVKVNALADPATVLPLGNVKEALLSIALGMIDGSIEIPSPEPAPEPSPEPAPKPESYK